MQGQDYRPPTLHVYPNMMEIPTLVVDRNQDPVSGIAGGRFYVSLDGGPKFRVTHVRPEGNDPISLAIVLDVSQPFPGLMKRMDDAVGGLAPQWLTARDHVSVYMMDCELTRTANQFPASKAVLSESVDEALRPWHEHGRQRWTKGCKTPMNLWDSLAQVIQDLSEQPGRRVVLVVTDGVDRGSKTPLDAVREFAQERAVAIFGMLQTGYGSFGAGSREFLFNSLCGLTGGIVMLAEPNHLAEKMERFTAMLRGRYIVEFPHPVDTKGGHHDMQITIGQSDALILPTGIGVPVDNPAVLEDPNTVPMNPEDAPQLGKQKAIGPK